LAVEKLSYLIFAGPKHAGRENFFIVNRGIDGFCAEEARLAGAEDLSDNRFRVTHAALDKCRIAALRNLFHLPYNAKMRFLPFDLFNRGRQLAHTSPITMQTGR